MTVTNDYSNYDDFVWSRYYPSEAEYNEPPTNKILVYGTLRSGEGNHSLMGNSKLLDIIRLRGYVMYTNGGFPYSVPVDDDNKSIVGEIYHVNKAVLSDLDSLEGVSFKHYDRVPAKGYTDVELYIPHSTTRVETLQVIESGDWKDNSYSYRR